jgi:2,4-dienoyl-CoA reductase-like NADH-dependent reductase (Old Yellow Enzyme family)
VIERHITYLRARAAGGAALGFIEAVNAEGALLGVELNHAGQVARAAVSEH